MRGGGAGPREPAARPGAPILLPEPLALTVLSTPEELLPILEGSSRPLPDGMPPPATAGSNAVTARLALSAQPHT